MGGRGSVGDDGKIDIVEGDGLLILHDGILT